MFCLSFAHWEKEAKTKTVRNENKIKYEMIQKHIHCKYCRFCFFHEHHFVGCNFPCSVFHLPTHMCISTRSLYTIHQPQPYNHMAKHWALNIMQWLRQWHETKKRHWMLQYEREYLVLQVRGRGRIPYLHRTYPKESKIQQYFFNVFVIILHSTFHFLKTIWRFSRVVFSAFIHTILESSLIPSFFSYQADEQFMVMLHQFTKSKTRKREGENCLDHPFSFI